MPFNSSGQYYDPPLSTWAPQTPIQPAQPDFGDPIFGQGIQTLTGLGVHPDVAQGAINYMYRNESKLDPTIVNPTSGAFGIGQWLGPRLQALKAKYGDSPTADQQFQHMTDELQGPEKATLARLLQAKSAKEGYDIWGSSYERPGAAALAKAGVGNKNMYPAFGAARLASQLMPSVEQTGGLPMDDPAAAPSPAPAELAAAYGGGGLPANVAATGGLFKSPATDPIAQLPELLKAARGSRDWGQILANMSAGFLGGRGPAQSLAGGFGGLAKGMQQGTEDNTSLLKLAMTMGLGTQSHQIQTFTALTNAGVPLATAAAASGLQLPTDTPGGMAGSGVHGDEFLKTIDPNVSSQVKALAEGRMQFPNGPALKTPYWQNMLRNVAQFDPEFDAINYNSRSKTRADFTSGKSAQNMTAINTTVGHLGTLLDAGNSLDNTSYPLVNQAVNSYRSATGDPRIVGFNTAKQAVADEMTRVFRGTGGSNADVEGWEKNLNAANSPEQLQTVIKQGVNLLASRASSIADQYKKGMGTTAQPLQLLNPHALETLKKIPGGDALLREMGGSIEAAPSPTAPTAATVGNGANTGALRSTPSGIKYRQISP
jgi:hypothetical protein